MPGEYDAIVDQVINADAARTETAAAPATPDPIYETFAENEVDRLRVVTSAGIMQDQARAARILNLQNRTNLPADFLDRNLDEVEQRVRTAGFDPDQYRKTSPKVAEWLAQQPEHLAVAFDDLSLLASAERAIRESPDYQWNVGGSISGPVDANGYRAFYRSTADLLNALRREQEREAFQEKAAAGYLAKVKSDFAPFGTLAVGAIQATDSTARLLGLSDGATAEKIGMASAKADPGFLADVQRGLGGLTADAPLMLAGMALAPLAYAKRLQQGGKLAQYAQAALTTAVASQPLALREGILTGRDEGWANGLVSWGIETAIPAAFGSTGSERIIEQLVARGVSREAAPSLARVAGRLLLDAGLEGIEEGVTEYAHAIHEVVSGMNPGALNPNQLWPRLAAAGAVGGIAGAGFNMPSAIASMTRRGLDIDRETNRLLQAASAQNTLETVMQAAQDSATVSRSPEAARGFFQSMVADKVPQVFLDREAWDAHFTSLNQDPRAKAVELMGDAKAYDEAAITGAPMRLDTGRLAVDVAKDKPTADWITREARLDPAMMNGREKDEYLAQLETLPDDPEAKVQQTAQEAAQAVQDDVEQQLTTAGYDAGSARRSAVQMAAMFRTMAARWNAGRKADDPNRTDARQLFLEWNIGINRPVPEILAQPTMQTAEQVIAARRAKLADAALAKIDAGRMAAQAAADQSLAQQASGDAGFALIQEATAALESAGSTLSTGDAMRVLGPAFGFRPDANAAVTTEQAQRGNLLAAALRVRGKTLADLIRDAGAAKPDPVATTASGPQADASPELEKLTADAFRLETLVTELRAGRGDLAELEQAAALAAEVGPVLDQLGLDAQRTADIRSAVEFAQDGQTLNQEPSETDPTAAPMADTIDVDGVQRPTLNSNGKRIAQTEDAVRAFWRYSDVVERHNKMLEENADIDGAVYHSPEDIERSRESAMTAAKEIALAYGLDVFWRGGDSVGSVGFFTDEMRHAAKFSPGKPPNEWAIDTGRSLDITDGESSAKDALVPFLKDNIDALSGDNREYADALLSDLNSIDTESEENNLGGTINNRRLHAIIRSLGYDSVEFTDEYGNYANAVMVFDADRKSVNLADAVFVDKTDDDSALHGATSVLDKIKSATGNRGTFDPSNPSILYQSAFHGTGNSQPYDRFDYNRVGGPGGEGAQAYGWGLYFAGKKEVGKWYKDVLSKRNTQDTEKAITSWMAEMSSRSPWASQWDEDGFDSWIVESGFRADIIEAIKKKDARGIAGILAPDADLDVVEKWVAENANWDKVSVSAGKLYTVDIPDDNELLDWDEWMESQPAGVREKVDAAFPEDEGYKPSQASATAGEWLAGQWEKYGKKEVSDRLKAAGIPGIRYLDGTSRGAGDGSRNYVIFDDSKVVIKSYEQRKDRNRGSITFNRKGGQRQTDIRLFEGADLSTVLHESGHLYLEMLIDLAGREGAPDDITGDLAAAMKWLGVSDPNQIRVEHHEKWARGFEAYLLEGKAPSAELRSVFARFAAWMAAIYQSVKNLNVTLTPEVRGVFDRLLATQEEIADASAKLGDDPVFADAKAAGMSDADFATYQKAREDARQQAEDALRVEAMREITRERTAAWEDLEREVRREVELEVNRAKEYVAESVLRRGELPGGVPLPPTMPAIKLDSADLRRRIENRFGTKEEHEANMARFAKMHTREGGLPVDQAAALLGFDSGDALMTAMMGLRKAGEVIKAETEQRMRSRFGDILTDGTIAEKAMDKLHGERRADVHLAEVKALATRVGRKVAPIEVLREAARRKINATPPKELLPQIYARAEAKARRALEKALAKQDFQAAWTAKQTELLNHEMYRAAIDAKREADEIQAYAKQFNEQKTRERIGKAGGWEWAVTRPDGTVDMATSEDEARALASKIAGSRFDRTSGYLEQIDALMEGYEFRRVTNKAISRRQSLKAWADAQAAAGAPVNIPPEVLADARRRNWREVPLSELRGVRDALANIAHLAKKKNELTKAQRERALDAVATNLRNTLARTHPQERIPDSGSKPGLAPAFIAAHRKAANIAREMDGDEDAGPFWDALIRPLNDAAADEARMLREAKEKQEAIWRKWATETADDGWPAGERREFDGFQGGLDRLGAIMVALNWGNEGNRERLLDGGQGRGPLTIQQVQKVLDSLNAADWNLVESVWDHIDSYWSEIKALEQRVTGTAPGKVEASPFPTTKHGTIKGGYFPIIYDGQETGRIDGDATDLAKQIQAQAFGRTATAHGHTKERSIGQGRRLNLNPEAIGGHLTKVVHDLTHREALADALRILLHEDVRRSIDARMGNATTRTLRQWIADIATGGTPPSANARLIGSMRRGFSISTMGFRAQTAALQLTGFANAATRVGPAYLAKGVANLFSERDGAAAWAFPATKSKMMAERDQTQTREQNEILGQFQKGKLERLQAWVGKYAFWMMQKVQGTVDRAVWLGAYEQALDQGREDAEAVAIADQTVKDTQSGGQTVDLAGVQRDPYAQILTGAYTYGSLVFNQLYDQGARIRRNPNDFATWASAFGNMMLVAALPAAMTAMLRAALRDDWPDDPQDSMAKRAAIEFASTILGTMPVVRETAGFLSGYGYSGPAVLKPLGDINKLGQQIGQGEIDAGLVRAVIDASGSTIGLPSGQAWATFGAGPSGGGLWDWLNNPSLDIRAPIFGPPPRR